MTVKFYLASDLHLEFGALTIDNTDNVDCLILAGDVIELRHLKESGTPQQHWVLEFFKNVSSQFPQVIWIPGNHEYYGSWFMQHSLDKARQWLVEHNINNVQLVNCATVDVKGVPVHCATLWTDLKGGDPVVVFDAGNTMNDYRKIRGATPASAGRRITPADTRQLHADAMKFLADATSDNAPCVVVTHHQPTLLGLRGGATHDNLDYAYASELSDFFLDRPSIKYWCSGHTHVSHRLLTIGPHGQQFLTNCRGYHGYEVISHKFQPMLFEL